jgi:hypothetical protein
MGVAPQKVQPIAEILANPWAAPAEEVKWRLSVIKPNSYALDRPPN